MSVFADAYARRALLMAVLVGALCGLVGVHVVLRRLSFFTMAMTHATFPGVVLAAIVGVDLLLGSGRLWCERIGPTTALAVALGVASGVLGLAVSQAYDVAAGAAIVLAACGFFLLSVLVAPRARRVPVVG